MDTWHNIYITDKTGKKFFNTNASPMSTASEIRNLTRHLEAIKANKKGYEFVDTNTAVLMLDNTPYGAVTYSDDELLNELFGE